MSVKVGKILIGILICVSFMFLAAARSFAQPPKNTILQVKTKSVKIKLLSPTGRNLSKTTFKLYSDNGIRCVTVPCPTNGKNWEGMTDRNGFILIPTKYIQKVTTISTTDFPDGTDLVSRARRDGTNYWSVRLK